MVNKVLPAIRAKWPREDVNKPIFIQQDNAPSHLILDDPVFCEAAREEGFDIRLVCQPPNSPDFNTLDLGFFRAIQAIQYKKEAKTIKDLVPAVEQVNGSIVHLFHCFVQQLKYSVKDLFHTCFVGILRVLSMESKQNVCNTTNCFEGSHESKRWQQDQNSSHAKGKTRERRSAAIANLM
jgi:hypothetical protein